MPKIKPPRGSYIPDEIFDYYMAHLSGSEYKVLSYIARRTFGFRKESDSISISQICDGIKRKDGTRLDYGTGLSRSTAIEALKVLTAEDGPVLAHRSTVENKKESDVNVYSLNLEEDEDVVRKSDHIRMPSSAEIELPCSPKIGPTTDSNTTYRENTPIVPSQENQIPINPETGEELVTVRSWKKRRAPKGHRPVDPNSNSARLQQMRENVHASPLDADQGSARSDTAPPPHSTQPAPPERDYVALWRQIVTSAPPVWNEQHDGHLLRAAKNDPEFTENADDLFRKAEVLNRNSEGGVWLTIQVFFSASRSNHQKHYHRIFSGQYDRMLNPQKGKRRNDWLDKYRTPTATLPADS